MPKGIMLTPEQQAERREEIIGFALQLVEENGFQKTSMREIAELAKMGKSSLYDFFKTKDEIIVYAIEREINKAIHKAHNIIADESSPERCLKKIMLYNLTIPKQYRTVLMWLNAEASYLDEEYKNRLQTIRFAYQDIIASVIENGIRAGIFRETDTLLASRLLINSMLSIVYTSRPSVSPEKMLDETMNIFLYGIMNNGGARL